MSNRRLLAVVMAICCVADFGRGFVFASDSSAGFGADETFDRPAAIMLGPIAAPDGTTADGASSGDRTPGGNLLWGIPLEVLTTTRERPLFSPSRRPPTAAAMDAPVKAVAPQIAPEPALSLLGTVESNGEGYALVIDTATHNIVRLKTGQGEGGWILRSVTKREAVLERNDRTDVLEMPPINGAGK